MDERVDYFISAVRMKGGHVTHVRVHKALSKNGFAPHGVVQPRSTVIVNIRSNARAYKTLELDGHHAEPGRPVCLVEVGSRFYLRTDPDTQPGDNLGELPTF